MSGALNSEERRSGTILLGNQGKKSVAGREIYLLGGELIVTSEDIVISTILGSCISVCVYDPCASIGGMNHYMLPGYCPCCQGLGSASAKYGGESMDRLLMEIKKKGGNVARCEFKIFGGGCVGGYSKHIGDMNISYAKEYIEKKGGTIKSFDVGGSVSRRVRFFTQNGEALIRRLPGCIDCS